MRSYLLARVAAVVSALGISAGAGAMVLTPVVNVTRIQSYTEYGDGDVVFDVDTAVAGCNGFWLRPIDKGFKQTFAVLLMAKASGIPVVVYAHDDQLWSGSTDKYCRVRNLTPQ